jgi:hypothetical protein
MALDPAPLSIVFNASQLALSELRKPKKVTLDTLEVDCTLNESHDFEADVTEFEVESGAKVSDHRLLKPVEFTLSGVISDTPLEQDLIGQAFAAASPLLGAAVSAAQAAGNLLAGDAIFTRDGFNKLVRLYEVGRETVKTTNGQLERQDGTFSIVTKYRTYDRMVVKSLRIQRDKATGLALPFVATFREIRLVDTQSADFQGQSQVDSTKALGDQGGSAAPQKIVDDGKTGAFRYIDNGLGGSLDRADRYLKQQLLNKGPFGFVNLGGD